jgi:sulfur carrier protein
MPNRMNILLNNETISVSEASTIRKLLDYINLQQKYYAVEVNEQIVPKSSHASFLLKEGDKVEIVTAIGGG